MARGFFGGMVWGGAVAAFGLIILSLAAPLPKSPDAATEAPAGVTATPVPAEDDAGMEGVGRDADLVELPPTAPVERDTAADTLDPMAQADTTPAAVPQVEDAAGDLANPAAPAQTAEVTAAPQDDPIAQTPAPDGPEAAASDAAPEALTPPVAPEVGAVDAALDAPETETTAPQVAGLDQAPGAPDAPAVDVPGDEVGLSIATDPAQPVAPEVAADAGFGAGPDVEPAPQVAVIEDAAPATPEVEAMEAPDAAPLEPGVDDAPAEAPDVIVDDRGAETAVDQPAEVSPGTGAVAGEQRADETSSATSDAAPDESVEETAEETEGERTTEAPPRETIFPQIGDAQAQVGEPTGLPGVTPPALTGVETEAPVQPEQPAEDPITAYAEPFDASVTKPLMSIVLIDDADAVGIEALADFPYPLSFAIDPTEPGAADKMRARREAGFEVVALIDLPAAALPADAEVALAAALAALPESVAVLEGIGSGIQGNRPLSDQVTEILAQTGHGLVTQDNGLNTVPKLAARSGVPTAIIFRDFDGAGQTPTVMRRFLDQAAFRAGQQGTVVMLGRVRPDTISALLLWGLQDRANRVALAPLSALLRKNNLR